MVLNKLKKTLSDAWNMLIEFPLPFLRHEDEEETVKTESSVLITQLFFPLVGAICGLLALLLATVFSKIFHPIPAAVVFAGILTYFCVYKDEGRGMAGIMSLVCLRNKGISFDDALVNLPDNASDLSHPVANVTMILVILFQLFAFILMAIYGYVYWLGAILILEFAIQADLATLPSLENGRPWLKIKKAKQRFVWFAAGFLVLFVLFNAPVATLILAGSAFGMSYGVKYYCLDRFDGIDSRIINLTAYVFELFALLLGMLILTKGQIILL